MTGDAGAEKIKDGTFHHKALPVSKAFTKSRPCRLMSLALPFSFSHTLKTDFQQQ